MDPICDHFPPVWGRFDGLPVAHRGRVHPQQLGNLLLRQPQSNTSVTQLALALGDLLLVGLAVPALALGDLLLVGLAVPALGLGDLLLVGLAVPALGLGALLLLLVQATQDDLPVKEPPNHKVCIGNPERRLDLCVARAISASSAGVNPIDKSSPFCAALFMPRQRLHLSAYSRYLP